jgi:PilZ domain-containing protein
MVGYTRDISETGLAIVVTSDSLGGQHDELVGRELRVVLDLPDGLSQLMGLVVRGLQIDDEKGRTSYLIGIRITQMDDKAWTDMVRYILNIKKRPS